MTRDGKRPASKELVRARLRVMRAQWRVERSLRGTWVATDRRNKATRALCRARANYFAATADLKRASEKLADLLKGEMV